jgi:hypothetical protein
VTTQLAVNPTTRTDHRRGVSARRSRPGGAARRRIAILTAGTHLLAGCYTYVPVGSAPATGASLAFEISDAGRVALADRLGPGVTRIEGEVTEATPEEYAVSVNAVSQINAGRTRWSGESVRIRRDYVVRSEQRKLSRGRTALAVGAAVVGFLAAVLTRSLIGGDGDKSPGGPGGGTGET